MAWVWLKIIGLALMTALLAVAGAGMSGCEATGVNTVRPANPPVSPTAEHLARITTNPTLESRAAVTSVFVDDASGLLKVQANVQSLVTGPSWIQYHFDWFDGRGMVIEGPSDGTARVQLLPGERVNLLGLAPTDRAADWRLTIRGL
ncbi:MAG: DUF1425 domain-containing protein [Planctomycetota bacterium]